MSASPLSPNHIANTRFALASTTEAGITATASGSQTTGYPITAQASQVSTVGTTGDSITLPKITSKQATDPTLGMVGSILFIRNDGSNSTTIYGASPDTINNVATGTGVALASGKTAQLIAYNYVQSTGVGSWMMITSA